MGRQKNCNKYTKHHRLPKAVGGSRSKRNIMDIFDHIHRAWHTLFGEMTPSKILHRIVSHWFDIEPTAEMIDMFDLIEREVRRNQ